MLSETIFALASATGRAGIAVIRLSGPATKDAILSFGCSLPLPRKATRAIFSDPSSGETLDDGLLLWFPAPHSFTGEDVAELHVHGGRAVIDSMLTALGAMNGLGPAEPGEFTRRAFEHEKMDLTQAEALADLVDAETRAQHRQALRQMGGELKELYDDWRLRLIQALAHLEVVIDFPDEGLPPEIMAKVWGEVDGLERSIESHLDDGGRGERIREGILVAIIGPPNAGKSSLLNFLAQRDAAIVSSTPGTTRDVIEVHIDLGGFAITLADTAGLRDSGDAIESEGVRRARRRAKAADLKVAVFDGARYPVKDTATLELIDNDTLAVVNKSDLLESQAHDISAEDMLSFISIKTGSGVERFLSRLQERVGGKADNGNAIPLTRARHRHALEECACAMKRARSAQLLELAAEDLRIAARALGRITGRVDVEEILDVVFRDFCIGK
jgi:tRNA modification GTPase